MSWLGKLVTLPIKAVNLPMQFVDYATDDGTNTTHERFAEPLENVSEWVDGFFDYLES